jgi:hypothetical protein
MRRLSARPPAAFLLAGAALGVVVLICLHVWRGSGYWDYSEGVYALTSRLFLHGGDLYGRIVAAQPPGLFAAGAAILAVHDSLSWLRLAIGIVQLATGVLGGVMVWRLTKSGAATALTPALVLLTPWAVRAHGELLPELFGAPLTLGILLAGERGRAPLAGLLAAVAVSFKLPFVLPAAVALACSRDRRLALMWGAGWLAAGAVLCLLVFGGDLWRDTVVAQLHSGHRHPAYLGQAAWGLAGLVLPAAVAVVARRRSVNPSGVVSLAALGSAWLVTILSTTKIGTILNVVVPVEGVLVPLAVTGAVLAWRSGRVRGLVAGAAVLFVLAQGVALVAEPARTGLPFLYPGATRGNWGRAASSTQIDAQAAAARACPPGVAYSGGPFVAFVAHRTMPADQPDQFLTEQSSTLHSVLLRMQAVTARCP